MRGFALAALGAASIAFASAPAAAKQYVDYTPQKGYWDINAVSVDPNHLDDYLTGISKSLNFWIGEVEKGRVVFAGEPGDESLNPMGAVHGGWALTMIDSACGCCAMSVLPPGVGYTTLETKGNMTRAIKPNSGIYRCEAKLLANGRQIITSDAKITGPDGKLYAHGTSTLMVLRP